jgi:hypothetical protein
MNLFELALQLRGMGRSQCGEFVVHGLEGRAYMAQQIFDGEGRFSLDELACCTWKILSLEESKLVEMKIRRSSMEKKLLEMTQKIRESEEMLAKK